MFLNIGQKSLNENYYHVTLLDKIVKSCLLKERHLGKIFFKRLSVTRNSKEIVIKEQVSERKFIIQPQDHCHRSGSGILMAQENT